MLRSCFRVPAQYRTTLAVLSLISLSAGTCESQQLQPVDPGIVARQVIADFLSLPIADTTLISLEAQDFKNSSLGCPVPGMAYMQAITPGHRTIVEAQGRRFDVRVAGENGKICQNIKRNNPIVASDSEAEIQAMVDLARRHLAGLLDTKAAIIRVHNIQPNNGQHLPVGCTPQCAEGSDVCGYIIGLYHDGRRYDYHVFDGLAVPCPPLL